MLKKTHLIKPYSVGKDKRSLAMIIPAEVVKSLGIIPDETYLILKINENNDLVFRPVNDKALE